VGKVHLIVTYYPSEKEIFAFYPVTHQYFITVIAEMNGIWYQNPLAMMMPFMYGGYTWIGY